MTNQINFTPANLGANPAPPGGAIIGKQNELFGYMDSGNERSLYRKHLAKAFGNLHNSGLKSSPSLYNKNILGPFRTSYNAGDVVTNSIVNTDIKYGREANQVGGNNLARVSGKSDGVSRNGSAMYSGNPRYVYDGSDYTRFKKLQAVNRTYNDSSFGLNPKDGSYVKSRLFRVR
tara:strand:+ start:63 stop:587 length:525 start_codon:yes stop_codon:yes gene_type:complete